MQQYSLLQTKLHIPLIRPDPSAGFGPSLVLRPRLIERLDAGLLAQSGFPPALTLISAPAGFGKTTLLAEWVTSFPDRAAWLSLDKGDNEQARFWTYLIAALQTLHAGLGQDALPLLQAPQQPPTRTIVTIVLNDVVALSQGAVLVLDDYHLISDPAIHEGMAFLLENLPPQMHVVISTRADPPLPIHRLRARGQLTELRSGDLRFNAEEAAEFLNAAMGLTLTREDVEVLEARTEGWIVGLQLAALSLQGRADAHEFITAFSGGHHYVLEYLTQEVVRRQPEPVQRFLMQTSILDRLYGPLCDAVTGGDEGEAMLAHLRQSNLFILPLDDEHRWHRYHHLFADLLGNLLRKAWPPESIRELHLRACDWYERNGRTAEAVNHALVAADFQRTARLIEDNSLAMVSRGELATLLRWIDALPEDVALSRPWLCIHQAWPLTLAGRADAAEPLLRQIEQQVPPQDLDSEGQEILGHVAAMRAMAAMMRGDMPQAIELAHRAGELLPADNVIPRNTTLYTLASAYQAQGEVERAERIQADVLKLGRAANNAWMVVRTLCDLADLQMIQGQLQRAADLCYEALQQAEERGARQLGIGGYALVQLGEIFYKRNDLVAAHDHALKGANLMQGWERPYEIVRGYTTLATILQAQDDADGARQALEQAEAIRSQHSNYPKLSSLVRSCQVRLCLAEEGPEEAARLATAMQLGQAGALVFREQEQLVLARVLVAQQRWNEVLPLLVRLAGEAEAGNRFGRLIEILALQAMVQQAQGDTGGALAALEKALAMGEPEGQVRIFVEQGAPMAALLQQAAAHSIAPDYVSSLLVAFEAEGIEIVPVPTPPETSPLVEPLTPRELEVLHLLGEGCSNRDIAEALVITLNTVKKYTGNIYGKLGVHSRTQAVVRAQELGLL
jgi:LuxR family transcriptional regulator, maltose regulon positive regulatory protein